MARLSLWLGASLLLVAQAGWSGGHDDARERVRRGELLPLEQIIERLRQHDDGQVLEVELERKFGRTVYELEVLDSAGRVHEYYFDATDGELIRRKRED